MKHKITYRTGRAARVPPYHMTVLYRCSKGNLWHLNFRVGLISRCSDYLAALKQSASPAGAETSGAGPCPESPSGWRASPSRWRRWSWTAGRGSSPGRPNLGFNWEDMLRRCQICYHILSRGHDWNHIPSWSVKRGKSHPFCPFPRCYLSYLSKSRACFDFCCRQDALTELWGS